MTTSISDKWILLDAQIDATYYRKLKRLYISDISFNAQDIMNYEREG